MNARQARDSVIPSALAERIKELVAQSQNCQFDLARITEELERLQQQIAQIGAVPESNPVPRPEKSESRLP